MASLEMSKYFKNNINTFQLNTHGIFFYSGNLWIHSLQGNLKIKSINFHYLTQLAHGCQWHPTLQDLSSIMSKCCRHSSGEDSQFIMWVIVNSSDRGCSVLLNYYVGNNQSYMLTVLNSIELKLPDVTPFNVRFYSRQDNKMCLC